MNLSNVRPDLVRAAKRLVRIANQVGANPRITSGFRTYDQQNKLYQLRQAGQWPYPVAPPGTSAHEFGYAIDIAVPDKTNQEDMGTVWVNWGHVYGGKADPVHFEWEGFSHRAPAATTAVDPSANFGRPGTVWDQFADVLLVQATSLLGGLASRIVSRAFLATSLYSLFGGEESMAVFYLSHPVELLRDTYSILRLLTPFRPLLG